MLWFNCDIMMRSMATFDESSQVNMDGMIVPSKKFPIATARRDCCRLCQEYDDCTGAQILEGNCMLFSNPLGKNDLMLIRVITSLQDPTEVTLSNLAIKVKCRYYVDIFVLHRETVDRFCN